MLLSSSAEALCFFLGAMSSMPAVRTFRFPLSFRLRKVRVMLS